MKTKTHLVLPQEILEEVDRIAGKRGRSLFFAQATQEKLEREHFLKTLEETKGALSDRSHPELTTGRDMGRYLRERRSAYRRRVKRLGREFFKEGRT